MANRSINNRYYDLDYFCLTDKNILFVKRDGRIIQISPSEFRSNDLIPSRDKNGNFIWTNAEITPSIVKKGDKVVRLETQCGIFYTTVGHKVFLGDGTVEASGNLKKGDELLVVNHIPLPEDPRKMNMLICSSAGRWSRVSPPTRSSMLRMA